METLEVMPPAAPEGARRDRDRDRENAEDLALFRDFLSSRAIAESGIEALRDSSLQRAREAYTKIYFRYRDRIYAYALRVLGNQQDAEDIFQEVFYRVYARAESFTEERSLSGWIFTIAHNLCLNKVRDRKPQDSIEDIELAIAPEEDIGEEWQEVIAQVMAMLPVEYREVILLREYEGMSYAEMTSVLQTTIPAIKSRLYRAKGKLRELLTPYYKENYGTR